LFEAELTQGTQYGLNSTTGLSHGKSSKPPSEIEPATSRLTTQFLKQLRYCVPHLIIRYYFIVFVVVLVVVVVVVVGGGH
jgi:hypothetical protein